MRRLITLFCSLTLVYFTTGCQSSSTEGDATEETSTTTKDTSSISLVKAPMTPAYTDASLGLGNMELNDTDSGYYANFLFDVENYELGVQTEDAEERGIANSKKGQHIHFILDNSPYSAHYTPEFSKKLEEGNHVFLAFLARSYHQSVKHSESYVVRNVAVGEASEDTVDLTAPHLFYSRPKGTYSGTDTENLLLDFFLLNTNISSSGNKVRATINGEEFMIDEWAPYYIQGLEKGVVSIKLELLDAEGNLIESPFNPVTREVTLK